MIYKLVLPKGNKTCEQTILSENWNKGQNFQQFAKHDEKGEDRWDRDEFYKIWSMNC